MRLPPEIGAIEPASERFYHVNNHLFAPGERWDLVCEGLSTCPRDDALAAGCTPSVLEERSWRFEWAGRGCREHVLGAHDRHYEPVYRRALASGMELGHVALIPYTGGREAAVAGRPGVLVFLRLGKDGRWRVATAYRVADRSRHPGPPTNGDFFRGAVLKWRDKTSLPGGA